MTRLPPVTLMIPTYNQATLIARAVDTALAQDYPLLDIVICDDNSTDNTQTVLDQYRNNPRISIHKNAENLGRVGNYKHILEHLAHGEWVLNLDGDDYLTDPRFISSSMRLITENGADVVFLQAGHEVRTADDQLISTALPHIPGTHLIQDGTTYFLNFHHFSHLATIFKKAEAVKLDFYRYDILSADIESFLRLALHGKVILYKAIAGVWVQHGSNESKKLSIEALEKNMLRITGPFDHAASMKSIQRKKLERWKTHKINNYLLNYLTVYFHQPQRLPGYLSHVIRKYAGPYLLLIIPLALTRALKKKLKPAGR